MPEHDAAPALCSAAASLKRDLPSDADDPPPFLTGGGEMGRLIRSMDWSTTSLGPIARWPQSLRTTISICLVSDLPICVIWGPDLVQVYNDAYRVICGDKHPRSMGQNFADCWKEAWPVIGEAHDSARAGDAAFLQSQHIFLERHGFVEECFFTFSFSPIRDEGGRVGGLFHPVIEMTNQMLGERRTRALCDLTANTSHAKSVDEALALAARTVAGYAFDLPFALFYALEPVDNMARLVGVAGLDADKLDAMQTVSLAAGVHAAWPMAEVLRTGIAMPVDDCGQPLLERASGRYAKPPGAALVLPITRPGADRPSAILVAGISPKLALNEAYRSFYDLLVAGVASAVANAGAIDDDRRRAKALAEMDRAKNVFFSNVSHEFRTPLTLLLGPAEDALASSDEPLPARQRERFEVIHRNGLRLQRLVNRLLDFSRIEAGRERAAFQPTALTESTTDLASNFRSACEKAGLELRVDCEPLAEPVFVDRAMWEKVVLNLISNAFKFTFQGHIAVTLRQRGAAAVLCVQDTGTGVPAADVALLFDRFHRVESARGRTHEGSGIGLALVQELVKLHGGAITVESVVAQGTNVTVLIPLGSRHLPADQINPERGAAQETLGARPFVEEAMRWLHSADQGGPAGPPVPELGGLASSVATAPAWPDDDRPLVLVADDNADMRQFIVRLLAGHFRTVAVADGQAALEAALQRPPDLVLTDVMMPRLDGFGLLHALRADPRTRHVPVIMLSARAGEDCRIEGLQEGADDCLAKPFSARELLARVTTHLHLARMRMEAGETVRLSEERFRALVGATSDVIYRMNADWSEMRHLEGRTFIASTHEPSRAWLLNYIPVDDPQRVVDAIEAAIRVKGVFELEHRVTRVDGTPGWTFSRAVPMLDSSGAIKEWFGAASNVTSRKQAEAAIRAQESRTYRILESITDGFFALDHGWRFIYVNAAGERFLDRATPGDLVGKCLWDEYPGTVGSEFERVYRSVATSGVGESFTAHYPNLDRWYQVTAYPAPDGLSVYFRDVTSQQRIEAQLHSSEERRRLALDAAQLGTWHLDVQTGSMQSDARFRAIWGTSQEHASYSQHFTDIHPDDRAAVQGAVDAATRLESPVPYAVEYRVLQANGSWHWVQANGRLTINDTDESRQVRSFDGTRADITARKEGEQERERLVASLRERDQRKDEFLATLAHELRNPLAPIRTGLHVMRLSTPDSAANEPIRAMMERQLGQMVRLIDDLMDLSRINRGTINLQLATGAAGSGAGDRAGHRGQPAGHRPGRACTGSGAARRADSCGRRPHSADSSVLEPARQRRQVHRARRPDLAHREPLGQRCRRIGVRQRHRHPGAHACARVRNVHPGRSHAETLVQRPGRRAFDRPTPGPYAWGVGPGPQPW